MRHDPLCEANEYGETYDCDCRKIARVREDTLAAVNLPEANMTYQRIGYAAALRDAVEAVRALDLHRHYRISCEPPHPVDWSQHRWCDAEADVLAAIEALGGER